MSLLEIGSGEGLYYEFEAPTANQPTVVFVNALTGSIDNWQGVVDPALREAGLGLLRYNLRPERSCQGAPLTGWCCLIPCAALVPGSTGLIMPARES